MRGEIIFHGLLGVAVTLIVTFLMLQGLSQGAQEVSTASILRGDVATATGYVIDRRTVTSGRNTITTATFSFTDAAGESHTVEEKIQGGTMFRATPGNVVTVRYAPDNPGIASIRTAEELEQKEKQGWIVLFILFAAITFAAAPIAFPRLRRSA